MPKGSAPFHALRINDLSLQVHLGCSAEERAQTQEVRVAVELRFRECPPGAQTDLLKDTLCYAEISSSIRSHCETREFQLIERMAFEVYQRICEMVGSQAEVAILIHKVRPPIPGILGGTSYACGDFRL